MSMPDVLYYARMLNTTKAGAKWPKFSITRQAGYYSPMEQLRTKNGISFTLLPKLTEGKGGVPSMRLQGKDSYNFTGLHDLFQDGKLSGFAYGWGYSQPTYANGKKKNPFYNYREDGYLFIIHYAGGDICPCFSKEDEESIREATRQIEEIEMLVIKQGRCLASPYCTMLKEGGFDELLRLLREQAH